MTFALFLLALPQQVLLSEDFSSGVPPTGWVELNNGNSVGWDPGSLNGTAAFHNDDSGYNDNAIFSPPIDASGVTQVGLHFDQLVTFASWRDHHYIDVSLDNGVTFVNVADDLSGDGLSSVVVDLSSYAGVNGVNISFHYTGDYASEWTVDDVVVSDSLTPPPPSILGTAVNPANGHTYHLLDSSTWTVAEANAVILGGHLATVRSQAENDWIWATFGNYGAQDRDLWIGLNDEAVEGTFVWSSGDPSSFRYWAAGQPDNNGGNENYVHIGELNTDQWNDMFDAASTSWSPGYYGVVEIGGGTGGPSMAVTNLVAGQTAQVDFSNCTANGVVYFVWSVVGGGPVNTPFGTGYVSPPFNIIPLTADANGNTNISKLVPSGLTGWNIWFHGADAGSATMLNSLALVIG
ncbi:MAG: hypothetical protein CMJ96_04330 [Planctomycetes bacterium]|nr:hypothetical protein [Planctomycetota bacterium]MDP7245023.1 lectin-like protein [Planctomycetota bacterium]